MRDIKFRGWNTKSHVMVEDIQVFARRDTISLNSCFDPDMIVLPLQYTGLKDKYGVEIYEGDILNYQRVEAFNRISPVTWLKSCWVIDGDIAKPLHYYYDSCLVIGNIYENEELVK